MALLVIVCHARNEALDLTFSFWSEFVSMRFFHRVEFSGGAGIVIHKRISRIDAMMHIRIPRVDDPWMHVSKWPEQRWYRGSSVIRLMMIL